MQLYLKYINRKQVLNDIQQRLSELDALSPQDKNFDQHSKDDGISDQCLQKAMKSLKAIRKNQSNVRTRDGYQHP